MFRKKIVFLITLSFVNNCFATDYSKEEKTTNFIITPSVAYRYDVFKWAIPSDRFPQKKLSELIWKNYIIQPGIKTEIAPKANEFTFSGQVKYGYILKNPSKSWDYDWHHDNQGTELYSKTLSSVKGNVLDLSGAIGYSLNLFNNNLLTFYLGYDYMDYRNKQYGFLQLALNQNKLVHPFNQLGSRYCFKTQSPWIGLSVNAQLNDRWSIIPTIKYYSFKYVGKGYWLLRDDLQQNPSLKHNAKGTGLGFDIDFIYKYNDNLDFKFNLETKKFKMKNGQYYMFYTADIDNPAITSTNKLYNLNLVSSAITTGIRYKF